LPLSVASHPTRSFDRLRMTAGFRGNAFGLIHKFEVHEAVRTAGPRNLVSSGTRPMREERWP